MKLLHQGNHKLTFTRSGNLDYPTHVHNAVELVVLEEGTTDIFWGKGHTTLHAGDIFFSFPNQVHGYSGSRDVCCYLLIIPMQPFLVPYSSTLLEKLPASPFLHREQWEHTGLLPLLEMAYRDAKTASEPVIQGYLQVIIGKLLALMSLGSSSSVPPDALQSVLLYVNDHYTQPLSRKQIAHATGYNESYISHIFSDTLHISLTEYILSLRLPDARKLLQQTDLPVSRIALELGFGSIRSFNRIFAQKTGLSPSAYRQEAQKDTPGTSQEVVP